MHHGTPASGAPLRRARRARPRAGHPAARLRPPGYGGSTRHAGRSVAAAPPTSTAIADAPRPRALSQLGDLRRRAARRSPAPRSATSGSWPSRASPQSRRTTPKGSTCSTGWARRTTSSSARCSRARRRCARTSSRGDRRCSPRRPTSSSRLMATLLGDEDRAVLTGEFAEYCSADGTRSRPASTAGSTTTSRSSRRGASSSRAIDRPVLLLHGEDDRFVPVSHGGGSPRGSRRRGADRCRRRPPDAGRAAHARGERLAAARS